MLLLYFSVRSHCFSVRRCERGNGSLVKGARGTVSLPRLWTMLRELSDLVRGSPQAVCCDFEEARELERGFRGFL